MTDSPSNTPPLNPEGSLETSAHLVSRVAESARERQEATQREAQRERPDFIQDVELSEVAYTLRPKYLPLSHIDYESFSEVMAKKWNLSLDIKSTKLDPTISQRISAEGHSSEEAFTAAIMKHVLQGRQPEFSLVGGRYPVSKSEFVDISRVSFTWESVLVSVGGISQIAEAVAQEVIELVAAAAGADRRWSAISDEVMAVAYATRTRVNLGAEDAFENFLSSAFRDFLANEVADGARFGAHAGGYQARNQLEPAEKAIVNVTLDDLTVKISNYDPITGLARESDMRFSVMARSDIRTGNVSVSSELPYDVHEECVSELIQAIESR